MAGPLVVFHPRFYGGGCAVKTKPALGLCLDLGRVIRWFSSVPGRRVGWNAGRICADFGPVAANSWLRKSDLAAVAFDGGVETEAGRLAWFLDGAGSGFAPHRPSFWPAAFA